MMKFHFSIAVWGDDHLETFTNMHLPSLLAPGNLPAFQRAFGLQYRIYTKRNHAEYLQSLRIIQEFSKVIDTEYSYIDDVDFSNPIVMDAFNEAMRRAMADATKDRAYLLMNNPDTFWGDGSFSHVADLIKHGKRVILNSAIRADKRTFMDDVAAKYLPQENGAIAVPNTDCIKIGYDNIHPYQRTSVWGGPDSSKMPIPIISEVGDEGYILNMSNMGVLCTIDDKLDGHFNGSTDNDYIKNFCKKDDDYHIIDNGNDAMVVELSDADRYVNNNLEGVPLTETAVAEFLQTNADWESFTLNNFRRKLYFNWSEIRSNKWDKTEREVDARTNTILNLRQISQWLSHLETLSLDDKYTSFIANFFQFTDLGKKIGKFRPRCVILPAPELFIDKLNYNYDAYRLCSELLRVFNLNESFYPLRSAEETIHELQCKYPIFKEIEIIPNVNSIDTDIIILATDVSLFEKLPKNDFDLKISKKCYHHLKNPIKALDTRVLGKITATLFLTFNEKSSIDLHLNRFFEKEHFFKDVKSILPLTYPQKFAKLKLFMLQKWIKFYMYMIDHPIYGKKTKKIKIKSIRSNIKLSTDKNALADNALSIFKTVQALIARNRLIEAYYLLKLTEFIFPKSEEILETENKLTHSILSNLDLLK